MIQTVSKENESMDRRVINKDEKHLSNEGLRKLWYIVWEI